MHSFPNCDTVVEAAGHIGHGAVLHGCRIGRNTMVGMNAVIMDNAVIGEESIVAALAFVKADMQVPPRSLVSGVPGKIIRELTPQEIEWKTMAQASTRISPPEAIQHCALYRRLPPLSRTAAASAASPVSIRCTK